MRQWGQGAKPAWWRVIARNKRSVALNLRQPRGQEIARELIAQADILIENFRPGTLEKWGMAPEALHAINPRLIIVRVSGYGQTGPYADRAGFGLVGEAMGGWRYLVGEPDGRPRAWGFPSATRLPPPMAAWARWRRCIIVRRRAAGRWSTARFTKRCCR